ncbi:MAG: hypothetical protein R2881_05795 [Eubacteriales bacterium]
MVETLCPFAANAYRECDLRQYLFLTGKIHDRDGIVPSLPYAASVLTPPLTGSIAMPESFAVCSRPDKNAAASSAPKSAMMRGVSGAGEGAGVAFGSCAANCAGDDPAPPEQAMSEQSNIIQIKTANRFMGIV